MPILVIGGHTRSIGKTSVVDGKQNPMIKATSIERYLKRMQYARVLARADADFKASAQTFLDRADAVLLHSVENVKGPAWKHVSLKPVIDRPIFAIHPPTYVTPEVVEFVRSRLVVRGDTETSLFKS